MRMRFHSGVKSRGFTIVEFMIATVVFVVVLLMCMTAIIQIGQQYYKGTITNRVQITSRTIIDDITQTIQFGVQATPTIISGPITVICIGQVRYSFLTTQSLGTATNQSPHVFWKDRSSLGNCDTNVPDLSSNTPSANGQELLGVDMRLVALNVTSVGPVYSVKLTVAYGRDNTVFADISGIPDYFHCMPFRRGGQFCSVSTISTQVVQRL